MTEPGFTSPQALSRQICLTSGLHRKNLAAAGPEKFSLEFIQKQVEEFDIGKRHLANMMGEDPETFSQEDIDVGHAHTRTRCPLLKPCGTSAFFFCVCAEEHRLPVPLGPV